MSESTYSKSRAGVSLGAVSISLLLMIVLVSCTPVVTVTLTPQAADRVRVVQIPPDHKGVLRVELGDGRTFKVPPGHFPPRGECRIWFASQPPGQQPPPGSCNDLSRRIPAEAVLLRR